MKIQERISRNALFWIILCMLFLVAPHAVRLPVWVLGVYVVAVLWRTMVFQGRWSFPGKIVKVALTVSCFIGIYASFDTLVTLEATVALLLTAFALKLIELVRRKDAYVLLFLGYFVCITEYLFSQDLLITLLGLINVGLVTTALVALHQPEQHDFSAKPLRLAGKMMLQALPLMVILFFFFPRFGPLWTVPLKSGIAKTGMSDFMKPGDVAGLSQSDEVAFRVSFEGDIPPRSELYWRGLVFSRLDEGVWSALGPFDLPAEEIRPAPVERVGDAVRYSVILEPTQQNWLYGLRLARSSHSGVLEAPDYRMYSPSPIESEFMYRVQTWPDAQLDLELSQWRRKIETRLPHGSDNRVRELARAMHAEAGSDTAFIAAVLDMFYTEPFVYTLQPGLLPEENGMDHFVFQSRRGFCEHYAYAFVLMMRAAGLPARVVAGYQGGEINPVNKTVIVHQFDAHAWAEVWLPGEGWRRFDPTSAVSPARIEFGLEEAMASEGSFLAERPLSPLRFRKIPLINQLRLRYDALTYRWQSWIVSFDNERQFELLHNWFGEVSARLFVSIFLGTWGLVLIPVAISLLRRQPTRKLKPLDQHYRTFCASLEKAGLVREPGETPAQFALRAQAELPQYSGQLEQITRLYNRLAYAEGSSVDERALRLFAKSVAGFKPLRRKAGGGAKAATA